MEETSTPVGEADLAPVFGPVDGDEIKETIARADKRLRALRDELAARGGDDWQTQGLTLETQPSGQASIDGTLANTAERVTFSVELRPENYFSEHPWRPGHAARPMSTSGWDVDGAVTVIVERRVLNKKYPIQETGADIEERHFTTAADAAAGLAEAVEQLAVLAGSREPTAAAWTPPEDEAPRPG
jgi:hypothetical protein